MAMEASFRKNRAHRQLKIDGRIRRWVGGQERLGTGESAQQSEAKQRPAFWDVEHGKSNGVGKSVGTVILAENTAAGASEIASGRRFLWLRVGFESPRKGWAVA